jgi:uncharacterized repeat protein (TIGR03803 family)
VTDNTDLIIDVDGYFAPRTSASQPADGAQALSLYTLAPCRVLDTRHSTGTFSGMLPVGVLASACSVPSAEAYVLNATVIPAGGHSVGYLSLWPDAEGQPVVSTLNAVDGALTSNMAIVPTLNGSIDAYVQNPADLVLDIFSYFAPITPLGIMTTSLPDGTFHYSYNATLAASGGVPPYTWSLTSGILPPGLNLDASGLISGTPSLGGPFAFTVEVADSQSPPAIKATPLFIDVDTTLTQLTVLTTSLPPGTQNTVYNVMLAATGGLTPYTWSITAGSLPIGLHLDANSGAITGTPSGAGISTFTVQVTDLQLSTASKQLSITIAPAVALSITTTSLPSGTAGVAYSASVTAVGGVYPYTWSVISGTLPDGLHLNAGTGAITGTPTTVGTSNFTVQVADAAMPPAIATAPLSIVINQPTRVFTLLHSFAGPDGSNPAAPLVHASDGNFYGTAATGGAHGGGTVFRMTANGTLTTVYNFCSQPGLYGCYDGATPQGIVQATDGNFYGVTNAGGTLCCGETPQGTAYKLTPRGAETVLYSFCSQSNCDDGKSPNYLMQASDGNFYGMNAAGGIDDQVGLLWQMSSGGSVNVLYGFSDSKFPYVQLLQGPGGQLYGTALHGGMYGDGTVFKITLSGGYTELYSFCSQPNCTDGAYPSAGRALGSDGSLYGTTSGGTITAGTAFKITPSGTLTTLYTFCSQSHCADGNHPGGGLVQGSDGNFYGTTVNGGLYGAGYGAGTIFELTPSGTLITLHSFNGADGLNPAVNLVQDAGGYLYGVTYAGGANSLGTVFSLSPPQ